MRVESQQIMDIFNVIKLYVRVKLVSSREHEKKKICRKLTKEMKFKEFLPSSFFVLLTPTPIILVIASLSSPPPHTHFL